MTADHIFVLAAVLLLLAVPVWVTLSMVTTFSAPQPFILRPPAGKDRFARLPPEIAGLVASHGLTLTDVLQFKDIPVAIFRAPPGLPPERYLVVMIAGGKHVCDFVTNFSAVISLTTTRGSHAFMFPRPAEAYMQGYTKLTLDQLWSKHLEGELYLLEKKRVVVQSHADEARDMALRIETVMRRQGEVIKAVPFFWLKAPWWFYVRRHLMVNKTLAQQYIAGTLNSS